jgi:hypothetical protein
MNGDYQGYYWDYTLEWETTNVITGTSLERRTCKVSIGTSLEWGTTKNIIGTSLGWETTRVFYVTAWNKKGRYPGITVYRIICQIHQIHSPQQKR